MSCHRTDRLAQLLRLMPIFCLNAAPWSCTAAPDPEVAPASVKDKPPAEGASPMAAFARMIGGEWKVTFESGESAFGSWHWGPGRHSIHGGELEVIYWHPGHKQIRLLSLHADILGVGRDSGEGTMSFEGETASGVLNLQQPRALRKLAMRWSFDGPDAYRDTLMEDSGSGFTTLAEWQRFRVPQRPESPPAAASESLKLPEHLKALEPLLGRTWEAQVEASGPVKQDAIQVHTIFEFVPDYVYGRVLVPSRDGAHAHLFDVFCYQDVRTSDLRCLALSSQRGVYEGKVTVDKDGALQFDGVEYQGDRVAPLAARFDFEDDGTLHQRVWSREGAERTLLFDVRHRQLKPSIDQAR